MATCYLGQSDEQFWYEETPRTLNTKIKEWKEIEKQKALYIALLNNGHPIPDGKRRLEDQDAAFDAL